MPEFQLVLLRAAFDQKLLRGATPPGVLHMCRGGTGDLAVGVIRVLSLTFRIG